MNSRRVTVTLPWESYLICKKRPAASLSEAIATFVQEGILSKKGGAEELEKARNTPTETQYLHER